MRPEKKGKHYVASSPPRTPFSQRLYETVFDPPTILQRTCRHSFPWIPIMTPHSIALFFFSLLIASSSPTPPLLQSPPGAPLVSFGSPFWGMIFFFLQASPTLGPFVQATFRNAGSGLLGPPQSSRTLFCLFFQSPPQFFDFPPQPPPHKIPRSDPRFQPMPLPLSRPLTTLFLPNLPHSQTLQFPLPLDSISTP